MDSLTQVVLGASVGEAVLGKKVGNRAPLWGAVCGTIPDLDVLANFFTGELNAMVMHRGFTHSFLFSFIAAPAIGFLIHKIYKEKWGSRKEWSFLAFWALFTHPLLDCFTTWGTQFFYPFSNYRVAFNTIFVVDPLYTIPFLICIMVVLFLHREHKWRRVWNKWGLILSSFYLVITVTNKFVAEAVFTNSLHNQGKSVVRLSTYPSPFNSILWYSIAEEPYGFDIGYYSLFSSNQNVSFTYIPKNHNLIEEAKKENNRVVEKMEWMTKGFYVLEEQDSTILWRDLRFGILNGMDQPLQKPQYVFTYKLVKENGEFVDIRQVRPDNEALNSEYFGKFWRKIWGD